jgi:porin
MAKRGVYLDLDLLQILQGVMTGGNARDVSYWGEASYTLNVDTGKAGLWPGGFLKIHALSSYGTSANRDAGALLPLTTASLLPALDEPGTALMNLTYTQFLTTWLGVIVGKLETLGGDANEFAHDYHSDFAAAGFNFNLTNALVPLSAIGGGVVLLPWKGAIVTAVVLDPDGTPNDDFGDPFSKGVVVTAEGRTAIAPFGLVGHQTLGFAWSNKERISLDQDPANIARLLLVERFPRLATLGPRLQAFIERFFPNLLAPVSPPTRESDAWNVYYNFDQYLWHPQGDTKRGIGIFFRFGVSDGEVNPVKYHYSAGIGGKGVVPSRPRDTFGIGWSRIEFTDKLLPFVRDRLRLGLGHEDVYEAFYNVAVAPWLGVTVNLQVVDQGLARTATGAGLASVDTAVIGGLRVFVRF